MRKVIKFRLNFLSSPSLIGIFSSALLIVTLSLLSFQRGYSRLQLEEELLSGLERRADLALRRHSKHKEYLDGYARADVHYVSRVLERLSFLEEESRALSAIASHPAFSKSEGIQERLKFLRSDANHLKFAETQRRSKRKIEEIEMCQMHPIQVDLNGLQSFLAAVEGCSFSGHEVPHDRPQLIIKEFSLEKERLFSSGEVFKLSSTLVQREIK